MLKRLIRNRKGQGLVEYALIIAGVTLICAVGIAIFGHKVSDMISATAVILPGAHTDDNGAIVSGKIIETSNNNGVIGLDTQTIQNDANTSRLFGNTEGYNSNAAQNPDNLVSEASANGTK
jgi:Flp pilus assembly pilin Flp